MKITILGAGAYGKALGQVLSDNGHLVKYYDKFVAPSIEDKIYDKLEESLEGAEAIVLAVPSEAAPELVAKLPRDLPLIVATKGFLDDKLFQDFDWIVLSGAGFAHDLAARHRMVLTTTDQRVVRMFSNEYLSFDVTDDKLGVLLCGALKNVYAISAGLSNIDTRTERGYKFLVEVVKELELILKENRCRPETASLSCGMPDLGITCTPESRNYNFGRALASDRNAKPTETVEGYTALKRIKAGAIIVPEQANKLKELLEYPWD